MKILFAFLVSLITSNYVFAEAPRNSSQDTQGSWRYYCVDAKAYYPYINQCPGGWLRVAPQPAPGTNNLNCSNPLDILDKAVCSDQELYSLYDELYLQQKKVLSINPGVRESQSSQSYKTNISKCKTSPSVADCLRDLFKTRSSEFKEIIQNAEKSAEKEDQNRIEKENKNQRDDEILKKQKERFVKQAREAEERNTYRLMIHNQIEKENKNQRDEAESRKKNEAERRAEKQYEEARVLAYQKKQKEQEEQEEEEEVKYQAFRHSSNGQLLYSFVYYQRVQACYEAREGYLNVYVNDVEMSDAKNKIRAVQSKLKNKLLNKSTIEQIWDQAVEINKKGGQVKYNLGFFRFPVKDIIHDVTHDIKTNPEIAEMFCPTFKSEFLNQLVEVLGSEPPKKDF